MTGGARGARRAGIGVFVALAAGYGALQRLGRTWGSTVDERRRLFPGDDIVPQPLWRTTHAITIDAPAEDVWPWLVQMGYHRGGWYTYEWVDRYLFRMSNPSADHVVPELQDVAVGDVIPDGPPDTAWYVVDELVRDHHLVLHSTTHVPPQWRSRAELGTWVNWTWTYVLEPTPGPTGRSTRLLVRVRATCGPWWLRALYLAAIVPADLVMSRSQLRGIRARCEGTTVARPSDRRPPLPTGHARGLASGPPTRSTAPTHNRAQGAGQ